MTVYQLVEIEPMDTLREEDIKRKYVRGEPLVKPEEVKKLSTRMYELHQWYMEITKTINRESLMVNSRKSITSMTQLCLLSIQNGFSYSVKTHSTNLSSVAIVCK